MPNQLNFRSDITTIQEPKFFASRIVNIPEEQILLQEIAGQIGYEQFDNIEVHFYEYRTNVLVLSTVIRPTDDDVLKLHITSYADGTYKTHLRIDFTKLFELKNITLLPNTYKMVLNFFSDEIGSYENRTLFIQEISPSQTELQLAFNNVNTQENNLLLYEFISKSFSKPFADGVAQKIFKSGVTLNNSAEGMIYKNVVDNITVNAIGQTFANTIQRVKDMNMEQMVEESVNAFIVSLYNNIQEQIINKNDRRIQGDELKQMIQTSVFQQLPKLQEMLGNRIQVT